MNEGDDEMKAEKGSRIKVVCKLNDFSEDYKDGDIFTVEDTWYGGVHVRTLSGIPVSLSKEEYELIGEEQPAVCEACHGGKPFLEQEEYSVVLNETGEAVLHLKGRQIPFGTLKYCPICGRRLAEH